MKDSTLSADADDEKDSQGVEIDVFSHFPGDFDEFLGDALDVWAEEIGWDIIGSAGGEKMLSLCKGECVGGATLIVDPPGVLYAGSTYTGDPFSSTVLGAEAIVYKEQMAIDAAAKYLYLLDASDVIQVVANWDDIRVYIVSKTVTKGRQEKVMVREMSIEAGVLDTIAEKTMLSLLGTSMRRDDLIDAVANVRSRKVTAVHSDGGADIMRAFLTGALFNMKDQVLQTFGSSTPDPYLLVTGEIARAMPLSSLLLSVIDGLQLRGRYNVCIDQNNAALPASIAIENNIFPLPVHSIYPTRYIYVSTEKGASGRSGQTAFRGKIIPPSGFMDETKDMEDMIVGQTGHIETFLTKEAGRLMLQPAKSVYFPNLEKMKHEGKQYLTTDITSQDDGVIMDCRNIPAVYGPDAQANMRRVRSWIQGLPDADEN